MSIISQTLTLCQLLKVFTVFILSSNSITLNQYICRVYLTCLDKLQNSVSHTNTRKKVHIQHMSPNSFRGTTQQRVGLSPLDFNLWGHFKIPSAFSCI